MFTENHPSRCYDGSYNSNANATSVVVMEAAVTNSRHKMLIEHLSLSGAGLMRVRSNTGGNYESLSADFFFGGKGTQYAGTTVQGPTNGSIELLIVTDSAALANSTNYSYSYRKITQSSVSPA